MKSQPIKPLSYPATASYTLPNGDAPQNKGHYAASHLSYLVGNGYTLSEGCLNNIRTVDSVVRNVSILRSGGPATVQALKCVRSLLHGRRERTLGEKNETGTVMSDSVRSEALLAEWNKWLDLVLETATTPQLAQSAINWLNGSIGSMEGVAHVRGIQK